MRLTFKKAFGFDFMPADTGFWLLELGRGAYTFAVRGTAVTIESEHLDKHGKNSTPSTGS